MSDVSEYFNSSISRDLFWMCVGKDLGYGCSRRVYEFAPDKSLVIKFEYGSRSFQNVTEWEIWKSVQKCKPVAKWFAPCVMISPCGTVMLQKKVMHLPAAPDKVPAFLSDLKKENFGWLDGKFVACDYGVNDMLQHGWTKRMVKAKWSPDSL